MTPNARKQLIIGGLILVGSLCASVSFEYTFIRTLRSFDEARRVVKSLDTPKYDAKNDRNLVHFSGRITVGEQHHRDGESWSPYVYDEEFGIAAIGVRLKRTVEMLQWVETVHDDSTPESRNASPGGATDERTYTYDLQWRSHVVDSSRFDDASYRNPPASAWLYQSRTFEVRM